MKLFFIATALLYFTAGMDLVPDTGLSMNDFADELILYCFSFLPISFVARTATVSQKFNKLSNSCISSLFRSDQADVSYKLDPCKIYSYYRETETSSAIKALTLLSLDSQRTSSLSWESFRLNYMLDRIGEQLFITCGETLYITEFGSGELEVGLNALLIKYYTPLSNSVADPSERLIDLVGIEALRPNLLRLPVEQLLLEHPDFKSSPSARKKLYQLYASELSKSLQVLLETNNVFDSRLNPEEVNSVELIVLSDLSHDEASIKKSLDFAERFIMTSTYLQLAQALDCITNTAFIIRVLKLRRITPRDLLAVSAALYIRPEARELFFALNDLEAIQASLLGDDDTVHMLIKFIYGIVTGMDDEGLIALGNALTEGFAIARSVAVYHKRSPAVLLALMSQDRSFEYYHPVVQAYPFCGYEVLDCSLADTITLLSGEMGQEFSNFISITKGQEYFEYMLDHADGPELDCALIRLADFVERIGTDRLYRKFLHRCLTTGMFEVLGSFSQNALLRMEVRDEIISAVRDGIDCSKIFTLTTFDSDSNCDLALNDSQIVVYKEILSWENGLDVVLDQLCANNEGDLETNTIRFLKVCLVNNVGFEMPSHLHPLMIVALDHFQNENGGVADDLVPIFRASQMTPSPSSFHAAVLKALSTPACSQLMLALGCIYLNS